MEQDIFLLIKAIALYDYRKYITFTVNTFITMGLYRKTEKLLGLCDKKGELREDELIHIDDDSTSAPDDTVYRYVWKNDNYILFRIFMSDGTVVDGTTGEIIDDTGGIILDTERNNCSYELHIQHQMSVGERTQTAPVKHQVQQG